MRDRPVGPPGGMLPTLIQPDRAWPFGCNVPEPN